MSEPRPSQDLWGEGRRSENLGTNVSTGDVISNHCGLLFVPIAVTILLSSYLLPGFCFAPSMLICKMKVNLYSFSKNITFWNLSLILLCGIRTLNKSSFFPTCQSFKQRMYDRKEFHFPFMSERAKDYFSLLILWLWENFVQVKPYSLSSPSWGSEENLIKTPQID